MHAGTVEPVATSSFDREQQVSVAKFVPDASQSAVIELADADSAAVLGAPGTGKTATLIEVVADRVNARGWNTDEVLALTTSRATATRLRDAIAVRVGRRG